MKQKKNSLRFRAIACLAAAAALFLTLLTGCGPKPVTTVIAASDFQPYHSTKDDPEQGQLYLQTILRQMKKDGYDIEGALFCGDYSKKGNTWGSVNVALNNAGVAAIMEVLETELGLGHESAVFVQGNHDPSFTKGLDPSGANDTEHYGVYVLHEDDYQWKQGSDLKPGITKSGNDDNDSKETTLATAAALEAYLKEKTEQKYTKPIFVCAHVPLHFSYRTQALSTLDNIYAKFIFDVLNEYAKQLNIIFLFGHNHSDTHDDYIGGGSVYLPVGDTILVPDEGDGNNFGKYTLNFTYMNAGYLGYYDGWCEGSGLSSTVFRIYEDRVEVARYSYEETDDVPGARLSNLKEVGVWDKFQAFGKFTKDLNTTTVYESTQTIALKTFETP